jgi:hypothetical protein
MSKQRSKDEDRVEKTRPVHVVRFGSVRASVWENHTQNGVMHSVTVTRSFKEGDEWHESTSFAREEIVLASKALDEAHSWIHRELERTSREDRQRRDRD